MCSRINFFNSFNNLVVWKLELQGRGTSELWMFTRRSVSFIVSFVMNLISPSSINTFFFSKRSSLSSSGLFLFPLLNLPDLRLRHYSLELQGVVVRIGEVFGVFVIEMLKKSPNIFVANFIVIKLILFDYLLDISNTNFLWLCFLVSINSS